MLLRKFLCVPLAVCLSGCGAVGGGTACGGADTVEVMTTLVRDNLVSQVRKQMRETDSDGSFSAAKVRAMIKQATVQLIDIRTTRNDPDSSRQFCEAKLNVSVPAETLDEANSARQMAEQNMIDELASDNEVDQQANSFIYAVEYSVQPTDDGKKTYVEMEKNLPIFSVLSELFAYSAASEGIRAARAQADQALAAQQREGRLAAEAEEQALNEQGNALLAEAKATYSMQNERIGAVWQSLPEGQRAQLLPIQRAWIKRKVADCRVEAAGSDQRPEAREAIRLKCESRLTAERANWLMNQRVDETEYN